MPRCLLSLLLIVVFVSPLFSQQPLLTVGKPYSFQLVVNQGKTVTARVIVAKFRPHYLPYSPDQGYWGMAESGGRKPGTLIKSIQVTYDSYEVSIPCSAVDYLANPTSVQFTSDKAGLYYLTLGLSDASGSAEVVFTFDHEELIRRQIFNEMQQLCEDIRYPHWHYARSVPDMTTADWSRWKNDAPPHNRYEVKPPQN